MSKITFVLISIVVSLIIGPLANAAPPSGIVKYDYWKPPKGSYPWNLTGHPACSDNNRREKPPYCNKNLPDWPDFKTATDRVRRLITSKNFLILSKAEKDLASNSKRFATGEYFFEAWNQAMQYFTYRDDNGDIKKISDAWIDEKKGQGFSIMSRALLQYSKGVDGRYFNVYEPQKNTPDVIANFQKSLKSANVILDSAPDQIKKTPLWLEYKLKIAYQLPELKKSAPELFEQAVKYWPQYPEIYKLAYVYSHPQHGGSYGAMKKVVDAALKNTEKQIGLTMYPVLLTGSWIVPEFDFKLSYSKMDWAQMKQGFKDYEKYLGGSMKYFYAFAELACKKQDQELTRHFYEKYTIKLKEMGTDLPWVMRTLSEENECRDWALAGKKRKFKMTRLERQKIKNRNFNIKKLAKLPVGNSIVKKESDKHNTQGDWSDYNESNKRLSSIFSIDDESNDLTDIQKAEEDIAYSRKRLKTGEYYFEPWIDHLNYHFKASYLFEPAFENPRAKFIDKWIKYQKGDGYSTIVKAMALYGKATDRFNSRYPKENSPGTLVTYAKYLMEANAVLDNASKKIKKTAAWFEYKLKLAYQHPKLKEDKEKLLADAVSAWPEYPAIYAIAFAYSDPNWGGSYKEMDAIAKLAVAKTKKSLGAAMYPQIIFEARLQNPGFEIPYQIIDWDLMKQGFSDYQKYLRGNSYIHYWFVDTACKVGDMKEVRRVLPVYEKLSNGRVSKSLEGCKKFAFSENDSGKSAVPPLIRKPGI